MMRKRNLLIVVVMLALAAVFWPKTATEQATIPAPATSAPRISSPPPMPRSADPLPAFLPPEARETIVAIQRGGPFAHRQDGAAFGNREGRLPRRERGFYREYTVDTPGVKHRGARRIVTGGSPPQVWYYTDNHYDTFRAFDADAFLHAMERP